MNDWRPSAELRALRQRAELLAILRQFFAHRGVLEVETPLLAAAAVTDLHLDSLSCDLAVGRRWLQTSPEYAMKRLLAAGAGPIYQICKAFRDGEVGRRHNPEFTILEWYRPGFDHHQLMDEMDELLATTLGSPIAERLTYGAAFGRYVGIDPHVATVAELQAIAKRTGIDVAGIDPDLETARDTWLDLLMSHLVEPALPPAAFIFDYPVSQAALARIRPGSPPVAERFEVYVDGVELANGFHELVDADEQRRRFEADVAHRRALGKPTIDLDQRLLAALGAGMPATAGVALGVDRLAMLRSGAASISAVISFDIDRA